jgi:hypothetical protein
LKREKNGRVKQMEEMKRLWNVNVFCTSACECFVGEGEKEIKRKMERPHVCGVIKMTKR